MVTPIVFKTSIEHYKYLKSLADKEFEGNLSKLIKHYLPTENSWMEEFKETKQ
jgi:hypothetical protein